MKKIFLSFLFFLLALISTHDFFHHGVPYTHDGDNHLARFANYYLALKEGQFPPRLAPNLLNHYSYPVFNYNYPLANIISLPFSIIGFSYTLTYKIIIFSFVSLGLWGAYQYLNIKGFSKSAKIFAVVLYAATPYLAINITVRGNIGEVMAFALLPWLFYLIEKFKHSKKILFDWSFFAFIFFLIMFFLAHNIAALFGSGLIILYAVFIYGRDKHAWKKFSFAFFWAVLASLWFWLPALLEKNLVTLDLVELNRQYAQHFLAFRQLLAVPLSFGYSYAGQVDNMSFGLGMSQMIVLSLSLIYLLIHWRKNPDKLALFFFIILILLIIGQVKISWPIYQIIPLVRYIQFPWRLALFMAVPFLYLAALLWQKSKTAWQIILTIVLFIQILQFITFFPVDHTYKNNLDYEFFAETTTISKENMPRTFTYQNFADWEATAKILEGAGTIKVDFWRGSKRQYQLQLTEESLIVEPTAYFKGWRTKFKMLNQDESEWQEIEYLDDEEIQGRIAYRLPAGTYIIYSSFTQQTWPRIVANSISLLALGSLTYLFIFLRRNKGIEKK